MPFFPLSSLFGTLDLNALNNPIHMIIKHKSIAIDEQYINAYNTLLDLSPIMLLKLKGSTAIKTNLAILELVY